MSTSPLPPSPAVAVGQWITIGRTTPGYVFQVNSDGSLEVGYYQNRLKAIKETVVWREECWRFKFQGPNGTYLRGEDEALVKRGPR